MPLIDKPLITLTTDFGLSDEYVGVMKGVISTKHPNATIIDLTHAIRSQDIRQAAIVIAASYQYFPNGSIHVVVVDPGVGSNRRIVLLKGAEHFFLVPDNGVATLLLPYLTKAYHVTDNSLFLSPLSDTFHGRDIFAPVAAHLATGLPADKTGPEISLNSLSLLPMPEPLLTESSLRGTVIDVDHFGNIVTNIDRQTLENFCKDNKADIDILIADQTLHGIHSNYKAGSSGSPVAYIGSRNFMEIGLNQGNFAQKHSVGLDSVVYLRKKCYA